MDYLTELIKQEFDGAQKADFTQYEIDATKYLYNRVRAIWGESKFKTAFPTSDSLIISRREYAKKIGVLSREDIDRVIDCAVQRMESGEEDFKWVNIGLILNAHKKLRHACHNDFKVIERVISEDDKKAVSEGFSALKESFNDN